ncbi:hypothetical protein QF026_008579 [Streptomyces aurantiacus]|nr:hypothetical protein [Streptomyces aurantiacus]
MRSGTVLEDLRVQQMRRAGGGWSYRSCGPTCSADEEADDFLRSHEGRGAQKTYAYYQWINRGRRGQGGDALR